MPETTKGQGYQPWPLSFSVRWCLDLALAGDRSDDLADVDLGRKLHDALRVKYEKGYGSVMCCMPERMGDELKFWINASKSTGLEAGWFSQTEVETLLKAG